MKNILLMLPLSLVMTVALAQNNETKKEDTKKSNSLTTLDGKVYKITLVDRVDDNESKSAVTKNKGGVKGDEGQNKNNMTNDSENKNSDAMTDPQTATEPAKMPVDHTAVGTDPNQAVSGNTTSASTDQEMESLGHKKMILKFENGSIHSSLLATKGVEDCVYHINSAEGNILVFSSNCKSSVTNVKGMWSGIAETNSIRGNFTWTTDDGRNISYTFTGIKASQKDIDHSEELGVR